jgi:urea transport system permease protein
MVVAVAVGGRFTLAGAVLGGLLFNWAKTQLSEAYPSGWLYLQGAMFIAVMTVAPRGVTGVLGRENLERAWRDRPAVRSARPLSDAARAALAAARAHEEAVARVARGSLQADVDEVAGGGSRP